MSESAATFHARAVLDNDYGMFTRVREMTREHLEQHGRFAPEEDLPMALVQYDSELGQEIREWVEESGVKEDGPTALLVKDVLGTVDWAEIAKDLHNEIVKEYAEENPELNIYVPENA